MTYNEICEAVLRKVGLDSIQERRGIKVTNVGDENSDAICPVCMEIARKHVRLVVEFSDCLPYPIFRLLCNGIRKWGIINYERYCRRRQPQLFSHVAQCYPLTALTVRLVTSVLPFIRHCSLDPSSLSSDALKCTNSASMPVGSTCILYHLKAFSQ